VLRLVGRPFPPSGHAPDQATLHRLPQQGTVPDLQSARLIDRGDRAVSDLLKEKSVAEVGAAVVKWKEEQASWRALRKLLAD
jgi:hypothetical protein